MNKKIFALLITFCVSSAPIYAEQVTNQRTITTALTALNKGSQKILLSAMAMGFGFGYFSFGYWNTTSPDEDIASFGKFQMIAGCVPFIGGILANSFIEQSIYHQIINEHAKLMDETAKEE